MGHAHAHTRGSGERVRHALRWSLALNGVFLVVEAAVGFWSGSLALLSDAAHMVSDVSALALALIVAELARRPASRGRTFGLVRAEVLGAFVNSLLLGGACVLLGSQAIARLYSGASEFHAEPVFIVGVLGLAINLGSAWLLYRSDRGNLNVRGALAHMLADALGSVGAILAAVLGGVFDLHAADPILSLAICVMILLGTWGVLRDSTRVLLDFVPEDLPQERVEAALRGLRSSVMDRRLWAFAAIGASLCCVGPLVLVTLGIGGAWISSLSKLEPLRPLFIVATLGLLAWAWHKLYRAPEVCEPGTSCADPKVRLRQRLIFWVVSVGLVQIGRASCRERVSSPV